MGHAPALTENAQYLRVNARSSGITRLILRRISGRGLADSLHRVDRGEKGYDYVSDCA